MRAEHNRFSALQRAEIAEICRVRRRLRRRLTRFSALQRAEIAEIRDVFESCGIGRLSFSALQRAEIAEMFLSAWVAVAVLKFQCSSTSRNC